MKHKSIQRHLLVLMLALLAFYTVCVRRGLLPPPTVAIELLTTPKANNTNFDGVYLHIQKAQRKLNIYSSGRLIKTYSVVFGANQTGPKVAQGDLRTPEGEYRVLAVDDHPEWSKFIWLSYPNTQDWHRHLLSKIRGEMNWFVPIGGEIGIHGVPYGADNWITTKNDWTLGCISLRNQDVIELSRYVRPGTRVLIVP